LTQLYVYFIVILLLVTSFGLKRPSSGLLRPKLIANNRIIIIIIIIIKTAILGTSHIIRKVLQCEA